MSAEAEPSSSGYVPGDVDDYISGEYKLISQGGGPKEKQNAVMTLIAHYALNLSQLLMGILFGVHAYFSRSMDRGECFVVTDSIFCKRTMLTNTMLEPKGSREREREREREQT
ncbi:unnamed protein product [Prunus armeniaca]|uniref:Uncharacterized protein n=1 Tax=Prunus armeniaca TaxID=36596 RepID=A0A6J5X2J6_PRUAR|nr:unnamed protein product [Prunus armeniaca]